MMRSLYAGVSGLRAHQTRMDVIGNNIANVNTTAFKASRVNFSDMFSQTLSGSVTPTSGNGGINPKQVGLGVGVSSIDVLQTQGSFQATGKVTDMAISGNGFFVLKDGQRYVYTRAGNFDWDANGNLVNPATGQKVQGWMADSTGQFPTRDVSTMTDLRLNFSDQVLAEATKNVTFDQELNANSPVGTAYTAAFTALDSLGAQHSIQLTFTKVADNAWDIHAVDDNGNDLDLDTPYAGAANIGGVPGDGNDSRIQFNSDGSLMDYDSDTTTPWTIDLEFSPTNGSTAPQTVSLDFSKVVQPSIPGADPTASSLRMLNYDGYTTGSPAEINIDSRGVVTAYYSNGSIREVGQVALAAFTNPGGLNKETGNNWSESSNSGLALIGAAGEGGRGTINPDGLEMSNVDIAAEFTNMIVTQRGFQANSKIITTSDEMLQDVVNLKR